MKKTVKLFILAFIAFLFLTSAIKINDASLKYKDFYFPVQKLTTPQVYHYTCSNQKFEDLYRVMSILKTKDSTFLITDIYQLDTNGFLSPVESIKELITDMGAEVLSYSNYLYKTEIDSVFNASKPVGFKAKTNIIDGSIFSWNLRGNQQLQWKYQYDNPIDTHDFTTVTKNRNFYRNGKIYLMGNTYETCVFNDTLNYRVYNTLKKSNSLNYNYLQKSYYAKGLGLCKYERKFGDQGLTYTLKEILSSDEFEEVKLNSKSIKINNN